MDPRTTDYEPDRQPSLDSKDRAVQSVAWVKILLAETTFGNVKTVCIILSIL